MQKKPLETAVFFGVFFAFFWRLLGAFIAARCYDL